MSPDPITLNLPSGSLRKRATAIHEAERHVIEAAKEWYIAPEKDGATADELALAIARLQEAERA